MLKNWLCVASFSALALLISPGISSAQRGGGYGHGGYGYGHGGYGYGHGGWGWGYGPYWYGYGYPYYYGDPYYYGPGPYVAAAPVAGPGAVAGPSSYATPQATPPVDANATVAYFELRVPANAEVWINGNKMNPTNEVVWHFATPTIEPGKTYNYEIRARWTDESGKVIDRTKRRTFQAGARIGVDLNVP